MDFLLKKVSSGYAADGGATPGDEAWGLYLNAANIRNHDAEEAKRSGAFLLEPDPLGQLRQWKSTLYVYKPRELPDHAVLSETVFERMTQAKPLYAPQSLFNLHETLNTKRTTITSAVTKLKETQSLSPEEHDAVLSFKDRLHLTRWPQYAAGLSDVTRPESVLDNGTRQANGAQSSG